jgi:hypothetical protein
MTNFLEQVSLSDNTKLELAIQNITNFNVSFLSSLINNYEQSLRNVWHSNISAQKIFDHYANNAYQLFEEAKRIEDFIKLYKPEYTPMTAIGEYEINEDGTVSVIKEAENIIM